LVSRFRSWPTSRRRQRLLDDDEFKAAKAKLLA